MTRYYDNFGSNAVSNEILARMESEKIAKTNTKTHTIIAYTIGIVWFVATTWLALTVS